MGKIDHQFENECQVIDPTTWKRRKNYEFFRDFLNPNVSVTVNVDASHAFSRAKSEGVSFFLLYFHAILRAMNEIDELHYRFDREGRILYYARIDGLAPIRMKGMDRFAELRFRYLPDFAEFAASAAVTMEKAATTDAYSVENSLSGFDMALVSAVPDLAFTSVAGTLRSSMGNDYPLVTVGKMSPDGNMPVALTIHHAFVDGEHVTRFYALVQKFLDE
ncbi:MAG: chloramphenicol acetyltransferase [Muribaculaceae bacterium]|nr:chloramphenicol acetyltransferase [Muribaculaceae bacterium]